jgi:hypothetical protein
LNTAVTIISGTAPPGHRPCCMAGWLRRWCEYCVGGTAMGDDLFIQRWSCMTTRPDTWLAWRGRGRGAGGGEVVRRRGQACAGKAGVRRQRLSRLWL